MHYHLSPHVVARLKLSLCCCLLLLLLTCRDFKQQAVKGGDKLDLGGGHVMEFVMAPNLHWPDTMFSFDHGTGACLVCMEAGHRAVATCGWSGV